MIARRRLLICAAAAVVPIPVRAKAPEQEVIWRGVAMGADAELRLWGEPQRAKAAVQAVARLIDDVEQDFSLYRPTSRLSRLNAAGRVEATARFEGLLAHADEVNRFTAGRFDPSVQPLWQALATGGDVVAAQARVGWRMPRRDGADLVLGGGQELTLNGIAQGHAADLVAALLAERGFSRALIQLGEVATLDGPFRLGVEDPDAGLVGQFTLRSRALAVSSPRAMLVGGQPHILSARGEKPIWSTVAVEADSATLADALSTALVFATEDEILALRGQLSTLGRVALVDFTGGMHVI
ncbi:MAG: FAD:protein FMN transferase [Paracoccaceae bacterium]